MEKRLSFCFIEHYNVTQPTIYVVQVQVIQVIQVTQVIQLIQVTFELFLAQMRAVDFGF